MVMPVMPVPFIIYDSLHYRKQM